MLGQPINAKCRKILIAGDFILRRGIASIVHEVLPGVSIVETSCFSDARAQLVSGDFFAAIFDIDRRDTNGPINFRTLRADHPQLIIGVLSRTDDAGVILRYLSEGVSGYILECSSQSEIECAIGAIIARAIYIPPSVMADADQPDQDLAVTSWRPKSRALTERQRSVLKLLQNRYSNKEIARELHLSHHTVKIHVSALLRYFSVESRIDLMVSASKASECRCNNDYNYVTFQKSSTIDHHYTHHGTVQS